MIRFTRDFQSKHTGERHYLAGSKAELGSEAESALIAEGAAELVTIVAREGQVDPAKDVTRETNQPQKVSRVTTLTGRAKRR